MLNSDFSKMSRNKKMNLINKIRPKNVPHLYDRCQITLDLFNHCKEINNFSFYNNLDFICSLIRDVKSYTLKQLNKYDQKLYKRIIKFLQINDDSDTNKNIKIILGIDWYLKGVPHYNQNLLFRNYYKITYKYKPLYFAIVRRGEIIEARTYYQLKYFNPYYSTFIKQTHSN